MAKRKRRRYTSKSKIAKAIETGLNEVAEDHSVFVSRIYGREDYFCGCALAIAAVGLTKFIGDPGLDAFGVLLTDDLVEAIIRGKIEPVRFFAHRLGISVNLSAKIDKLHRQDGVSARQIAQLLRRNQI